MSAKFISLCSRLYDNRILTTSSKNNAKFLTPRFAAYIPTTSNMFVLLFPMKMLLRTYPCQRLINMQYPRRSKIDRACIVKPVQSGLPCFTRWKKCGQDIRGAIGFDISGFSGWVDALLGNYRRRLRRRVDVYIP